MGEEAAKSQPLTRLLDAEASDDGKDRIGSAFTQGFVVGQRFKLGGQDAEGSKSFANSRRTFIRLCFYAILFWILIRLLSNASFSLKGRGVRMLLGGDEGEVNPEDVHVTFEDVKGVREAKAEVEEIVEYLADPEKFSRLGGRLPKGVLLVGPPGTGKTLLARAIAGEAGVPFFHASGSEFDEILVGQGAKRVRDLFANAKERAPAVIFIDEIDSVGAKRVSSSIHPYANQTINQLLAEMDGFEGNGGVIVIGATNRREDLDKALLRPGRFDVQVEVSYPDLKDRTEIFELYLSKVSVEENVEARPLAEITTGFTGADIENMVNTAAIRAAADGLHLIPHKYFISARDKVSMGPEKKSRIPDEATNRNTAFHEAGHALVAFYTRGALPIDKVTIVPRGSSLGHTGFVPPEASLYSQTRQEIQASMDVAMGGRAAEELIFGLDHVTTGARADLRGATDSAQEMVKLYGFSEKAGLRYVEDSGDGFYGGGGSTLGPQTQETLDSEIKRLLQESYDRALALLRTHAKEHRRLAEALLEHETLDKAAVEAVIAGKPLPPSASPNPS